MWIWDLGLRLKVCAATLLVSLAQSGCQKGLPFEAGRPYDLTSTRFGA